MVPENLEQRGSLVIVICFCCHCCCLRLSDSPLLLSPLPALSCLLLLSLCCSASSQVNPHIEAMVELLKRQYFVIVEMVGMARSGFSHPNDNGICNKLFPHFGELRVAFGRDSSSSCYMEAKRQADLTDLLLGC
ncbi:hypothetical protein HN51_022012 [Arachis hypogaea]